MEQIRVGIDVGSREHCVGIASADGEILDEFRIAHTRAGFEEFFDRVGGWSSRLGCSVAVAMEGYNGHARPLDREILSRGWRLYNVNNLKLARYKEIFPGPAKTDRLDVVKILELFRLRETLPMAKDVLQEVLEVPCVNERLKRLTRRRRQLVEEKVRVVNRLHSDLQAVCPGLVGITGRVDNLWFLRFLVSRGDLRQLARMRRSSLLRIEGVGRRYGEAIVRWQAEAEFSGEVEYVGPMIISDARRVLGLLEEISGLEVQIVELSRGSEIASLLRTIPGFGRITSAELAGEIGVLERFEREGSLALYLGMCPVSHESGRYRGSRSPRQVNWRAKLAMMTAVARHLEQVGESRAYYERKRSEGKRHNQAVRSLGRHLVRVIWAMLRDRRHYWLREEVCSS